MHPCEWLSLPSESDRMTNSFFYSNIIVKKGHLEETNFTGESVSVCTEYYSAPVKIHMYQI